MDQIHVLRHFTDDFSKYWWPLSDQERLFFSTTSAARHLKSFSNPTVIVFCSTFQTFCYRSTRAWARSFFPFYRPILDNLRLEQKKSPPTRLPEDKSVRPHCSLAFWGRPEKNGKLGVHNRRSRSEKKSWSAAAAALCYLGRRWRGPWLLWWAIWWPDWSSPVRARARAGSRGSTDCPSGTRWTPAAGAPSLKKKSSKTKKKNEEVNGWKKKTTPFFHRSPVEKIASTWMKCRLERCGFLNTNIRLQKRHQTKLGLCTDSSRFICFCVKAWMNFMEEIKQWTWTAFVKAGAKSIFKKLADKITINCDYVGWFEKKIALDRQKKQMNREKRDISHWIFIGCWAVHFHRMNRIKKQTSKWLLVKNGNTKRPAVVNSEWGKKNQWPNGHDGRIVTSRFYWRTERPPQCIDTINWLNKLFLGTTNRAEEVQVKVDGKWYELVGNLTNGRD